MLSWKRPRAYYQESCRGHLWEVSLAPATDRTKHHEAAPLTTRPQIALATSANANSQPVLRSCEVTLSLLGGKNLFNVHMIAYGYYAAVFANNMTTENP